MEQLPKRSDNIYKEIESFEDYELTQCVAYEMAIRNTYNVNYLNKLIDYYTENKKEIENCNYETHYLVEDRYIETSKYGIFLELIKQSEVIPFISSETCYGHDSLANEDYFIDNLLYYEDNRIDKRIYHILNDITIHEDGNRKRCFWSECTRVITDDILDDNILEKRTFGDGYYIITSISESIEHAVIGINEEESDENKELENVEDWKKHFETGGENLRTLNAIFDNFKRPKLKIIGEFYHKYPDFEVDLSRPLNEIIAYVTHVKNDIEKNNLAKAPIELIGEELEKADNLVCDNKGKCFDTRETLSKQQKIADLFFIYDYLKAKDELNSERFSSNTHRKIQNEVIDYYEAINIDTKILDIKTAKRYKTIAIDYIDNMRYKELITGIKL